MMNGYDGELTVIGKVFEKEKKRFGKKKILKVQFRMRRDFLNVSVSRNKYFYSVFMKGMFLPFHPNRINQNMVHYSLFILILTE